MPDKRQEQRPRAAGTCRQIPFCRAVVQSEILFCTNLRPQTLGRTPPCPGVPWACGCLAELSGKCGASGSLGNRPREQDGGWAGSAVPSSRGALCNHGNAASEPSATASDPARAAATSSRPGWVGDMQAWYDPRAMLLGGGESSSKILENIRLWGPRGEKGLRVGNNQIFGQRETVDGV